jgi:SAM-dependent methyltransferase
MFLRSPGIHIEVRRVSASAKFDDAFEAGACPVCRAACTVVDTVDFNKSCEELRGTVLPPSGIPVAYLLCGHCGFCFAPEMCRWGLSDFAAKVYNADYERVDPDYASARPRANAQMLMQILGSEAAELRHLDYGGGNGMLCELLRDAGWQSTSYDPFVDGDLRHLDFGKFDLVTAFEVFEHVPSPNRLVTEIDSLLDDDGVVLFTTLVSDGNLGAGRKLDWWYASPRNGHISLYSTGSLARLAAGHGFTFGSFSVGFHALWRKTPPWANAVLALAQSP